MSSRRRSAADIELCALATVPFCPEIRSSEALISDARPGWYATLVRSVPPAPATSAGVAVTSSDSPEAGPVATESCEPSPVAASPAILPAASLPVADRPVNPIEDRGDAILRLAADPKAVEDTNSRPELEVANAGRPEAAKRAFNSSAAVCGVLATGRVAVRLDEPTLMVSVS